MIVKVCDALCGAGKTQSCIQMMNTCKDKKYIFITPYLDEVERIKRSCRSREFVSPERKYSNGYSKLQDIHSLLRAGKNIASTHSLFSCYTEETKELIVKGGYTLVLDEVIDLFHPVSYDGGDINLLVRNNIARKEEDNILWDDEEYEGIVFNDLMQMSKSKNLVDYDGQFFFWAIPIDVFKCFQDCYVLTYLFEYQMLKYYFDIYDIQYELIGTKHIDNKYEFCPIEEMDRKIELRNKIHICQNPKYNEIGEKSFSLSAGWFDRASKQEGKPLLAALQRNMYNFFRQRGSPCGDKMWTTLNRFKIDIKGKGYANGFVVFNKRASNDFSDKHELAYCLNVFMQPWMKNYLLKLGVPDVNQDMYALSVLIQWMFRSAVRKGEDVWIYIPSKRMRFLLEAWLNNLAEGKDLREIVFNTKRIAPRNKNKIDRALQGLSRRRNNE